MNIAIFEEITTESVLSEIEANSKKYQGLYVEMDNPPERKYVKGKAVQINDLLKKLDRARIDKSKEYKQKVEAEAERIRLRLVAANEPFTALIDEYTKKRAAILAKEKAAREAIELREQIAKDHEFALLLDNQREAEKLQAEKDRIEHEESLNKSAVESARIKFQKEAEQAATRERVAVAAREANKGHKAAINNAAMNDLIKAGLSKDDAKTAVAAIASGKVSGVSIYY